MTSPRPVRIPCEGAVIEGFLELPENAESLVLFAHGSGSSRYSPRNNFVAGILRSKGTGTFLMDLLTPEEEDVLALRFDIGLLTERLVRAARWMSTEPATAPFPLGFFGASTGAAAALEAAGILGAGIRAVVSRGGRPDLADRRTLGRVLAPTLLIVGENDPEVIELNRQAYKELLCQKDLVIVPGATHLFEESGTLEKVADLASDWFVRYLPRAFED
ncbi:MAG: alpha/beta hydrolase [Nitrospirota bacterium]|nr:alpha/beta hydrolase [Nitrospirota bacterium]